MKFHVYLFLAVIFLLKSTILFAQWEIQQTNPPFHGDLYSVSFPDSTHGWACGDSGVIYKYNGINWTKDSSGTNFKLTSVCFSDSLNGWIVGDSGLILQYKNGNWQSTSSPTNGNLLKVSSPDRRHAWILKFDSLFEYVADSGWRSINDPSSMGKRDCYLLDSTQGWVVGGLNYFQYYSNNSWTSVPFFLISMWETLDKVYFQTLYTGWILGYWYSNPLHSGYFTESWNGTHWENEFSHLFGTHFNSVTAAGDRTWFIGSSGNVVCKDHSVWANQVTGTTEKLYEVSFANNNEGWIVGANGIILHTLNGGFQNIIPINLETSLTIFPNPVADNLSIEIKSKQDKTAEIQVWDIYGKLINTHSFDLKTGENNISLNFSTLEHAPYWLIMITPKEIIRKKLIKL